MEDKPSCTPFVFVCVCSASLVKITDTNKLSLLVVNPASYSGGFDFESQL